MLYHKFIVFTVVALLNLAGYQYSSSTKTFETTSTATSFKVPGMACCRKTKCTKSVQDSNKPMVKGCVFRTIFKEEPATGFLTYKTPENIESALNKGLDWTL